MLGAFESMHDVSMPIENMPMFDFNGSKDQGYTETTFVEVDDYGISGVNHIAHAVRGGGGGHHNQTISVSAPRFFTEENYKRIGLGNTVFDTPSQALLDIVSKKNFVKSMHHGRGLMDKYRNYLKADKSTNIIPKSPLKSPGLQLKDRTENLRVPSMDKSGPSHSNDDNMFPDVVPGRNIAKTKGDTEFWDDWDNLLVSIFDESTCINRSFAQSFDRSAAIICGYLIRNGIFFKRAFDLLRCHRRNIFLKNAGFVKQLIELDYIINQAKNQTEFLDYRYKMNLKNKSRQDEILLGFINEPKYSLIDRPQFGAKYMIDNDNNNSGNKNERGGNGRHKKYTIIGASGLGSNNNGTSGDKRGSKRKRRRRRRGGRKSTAGGKRRKTRKSRKRAAWDVSYQTEDEDSITTDESFSSSSSEINDYSQVWTPKVQTPRQSKAVKRKTVRMRASALKQTSTNSEARRSRPGSARAYRSDGEEMIGSSVGFDLGGDDNDLDGGMSERRRRRRKKKEKKRPMTERSAKSQTSEKSFDFEGFGNDIDFDGNGTGTGTNTNATTPHDDFLDVNGRKSAPWERNGIDDVNDDDAFHAVVGPNEYANSPMNLGASPNVLNVRNGLNGMNGFNRMNGMNGSGALVQPPL